MLTKLVSVFDRLNSAYGLYAILAGTTLFGVIAGWIARTSAHVMGFGAIGIMGVGLSAACLFALTAWISALARYKWAEAKVFQKWGREVDAINPMEQHFRQKRIRLADLAHPITLKISDKQFHNCELLGPATAFLGLNGAIVGCEFHACSVLVAFPDQDGMIRPGRMIVLQNVEFYNCHFSQVTMVINPRLVDNFLEMGAHILTLVGRSDLDNPRIAAVKQR